MKPLFDINTLNNFKYNELLPLECEFCKNKFFRMQKYIKRSLNNKSNRYFMKYCSRKCLTDSQRNVRSLKCEVCQTEFSRIISQIKSNKSFCSQSCSATYHNTHKTTGTRISKLEKYLQSELIKLYPHLEFHFNKKDAINSELDIHIPSLKLAFELNGIFHYEPIFGKEKLDQIKNNDSRKFQACLENNIELCIIDSSKFTYFKIEKAKYFLDIITNIINSKLN